MPRFSNYGALDNPLIDEGDRGFVRMNNRLRPDQLQAGELAMSQNGRMGIDGAWQPRKGIQQFGPILSSSASALKVPFYLYSNQVITALARVNATVTITLGKQGWSCGATTAGNVAHYIERAVSVTSTGGYLTFSICSESAVAGPISLSEQNYPGLFTAADVVPVEPTLAWSRYSLTGYIPAGSYTFAFRIYITNDGSAAPYVQSGEQQNLMDAQLEWSQTATRCEPTTSSAGTKNLLTYSNDFNNAAWTKSAVAVQAAPDVNGYGRFVNGSTANIDGVGGSPTVDPEGNRTITRVSGVSYTYTITGATGNETYTVSGSTLLGAGILSAETNKVYGSCLFSDPSSSNAEYILLAQNASCVAVNRITGAATTITYPAGVTLTSAVDMLQAFNKVFIFRNGLQALEWNGTITGSPAFTKVTAGTYTQPLVLTGAGNAAASGGVVTITNTHNLAVGDTVTIMDKGSTGLTVGDKYTVATISTTTAFTFYADVDDFSGQSVVLGVGQSVGRGYQYMPCPPWAIYHQRRLWMPYNYTTSGTGPTITDRNIRDELIASDIFDSDTYDVLQNQFKIASGGADYIVAIYPFADDNLLVLCRNSIHIIVGVSGEIQDTVVKEITREVGCVSRKSVAQIGNQVFFLSDNGVYSVDFGDLYNLRGATIPLSEAIQPIISRINQSYAENAIGIYHDNRYWLFFPLDSSILNNAAIVYNVLNQGWESLDVVGSDGWDVTNAIRAGAGDVNKLYTVNTFGGIHILDYREDDHDNLVLLPGGSSVPRAIASELKSRMFTNGSLDRKRYNSYELHVESSPVNVSDAAIAFETENPDSTATLASVATSLGAELPESEDATVRGRIGNLRGYGGQMTIAPTRGRPKIRSLKVVSQLTDLPVSSKQ